MKNDKQFKHQEGYVLGWVLIVMLVLSILLSSILAASVSYHEKIMKKRDKVQAYYTARSMAELTADAMTGTQPRDYELVQNITTALAAGEEKFDIEVEGLRDSMGDCILRVNYSKETSQLCITSTVILRDSQVSLTACLNRISSEDGDVWQLEGFKVGEGLAKK